MDADECDVFLRNPRILRVATPRIDRVIDIIDDLRGARNVVGLRNRQQVTPRDVLELSVDTHEVLVRPWVIWRIGVGDVIRGR